MSYDNNISDGGRKDKIGRQIVLPFRKAFKIAWKSIRIRIWRSLITTSGIVLAIAFLMSVWTSGAFTDRLREVPDSDPRHDAVQQALREQAISGGQINIRIGILGGNDLGETGHTLDLILRDKLLGTKAFVPNLMPKKYEEIENILRSENNDKGMDSLILLSLSQDLATKDTLSLLLDFINNGGNLLILGHQNVLPENTSNDVVAEFEKLLPAKPKSNTIMIATTELQKTDHPAAKRISTQQATDIVFLETEKKAESIALAGTHANNMIWMAHRDDGTVFWLPFTPQEMLESETVNWLFKGNVVNSILQWASQDKLQGDVMGKRKLWLVSLSLLVCIVGITNAMLMSVTERFREIGTMKCLGALDRFVVRLFLIESSFQGAIGSILGAIIGLGLATLQTMFAYRITDAASGTTYWLAFDFFPFTRIIFWMVISIVVGIVLSVVAAIYPAYRAARMEPVDAMRSEA